MGIDHHNVTPTSPAGQDISEKKARVMPAVGIYRPPAARRLAAQGTPPAAVAEKPKSKQRRPDIQVYVPRPKRASPGGHSGVSQNVLSQPVSETRSSRRQPANQSPPADVANPSQKSNEDEMQRMLDISPTTIEKNAFQDICSKRPSNTESGSILEVGSSQFTFDLPMKEVVSSQLLDRDKLSSNVDIYYFNAVPKLSSESVTNESLAVENSSKHTDIVAEQILLPQCADFGSQNVESDACADIKEPLVMDKQDFPNVSESVLMPENIECVKVVSVDDTTSELSSIENVCLVEILAKDRLEKCDDKKGDLCRVREDQNRKNRSIHRGNISYISDLLVISDSEANRDMAPQVVTNPVECSEELTNESTKLDSEQPQSTTVRLNPDECTWDMMFDENGDCLDPLLMEELTRKVGEVTIKTPQSDYKQFVTREALPRDEYSHVIEIYNFPPEFKTQDLITVFSAYRSRGFEIKWVDDTHALGVFSSSVIAEKVLETQHPFLKTRPLYEATPESRAKARRTSEFLQPYRARPETCPALARRMVTGALGVRLSTAKQEREAEKALLKVARDKKKLEARQKDEAWEGTLGSSTHTTDT